jgi:transcriptional regulator with XRE-family HTH domain
MLTTASSIDRGAADFRLRALRDALGVPRERVAFLAGVSVGTVKNAERGAHKTTVANRRAIAAALGVNVATIWPDEFLPENEARRADD